MQAFQYAESFLIATEVDSSDASIIRVTNSLGTYSSIKELYVIDNDSLKIIASNRNKFNGESLDVLSGRYNLNNIYYLINTGKKAFYELGDNNYFLGYRSKIISEDKKNIRPISIIMLVTPGSLSKFILNFEKNLFIQSAIVFSLAILSFFILLKYILLTPIKSIVNTITSEKESDTPVLCEINSNDEFATLATAYNKLIIEKHEKNKELVSINKQLEKLSQSDALTGLSNRRRFDYTLDVEWHRAMRNHEVISLIMIDVDHFKKFNDNYGHLKGDECLKLVANVLQNNIKRAGDLISRFGGEEFAIILPNSNGKIATFAESCRVKVENLRILNDENNKPIQVTVSLGVASLIPAKGQQCDELIKAADMALYKAKAAGRNLVMVHENNLKLISDEDSNVMAFKSH